MFISYKFTESSYFFSTTIFYFKDNRGKNKNMIEK